MNKYVLTISKEYVTNWGLWEAIRELLQNAIDGGEYSVDYEEGILGITSKGAFLGSETLILGVTDKPAYSKPIGQFGEGYKLALVVLLRLGYEIEIYNQHLIWVPSFEYNEQFGCELLTITEIEVKGEYLDLTFSINDISEDDYRDIQSNFLPDAEPNTMLLDAKHRGKVFVSGLFVANHDKLEYGYNFSPDRLRLDRDRMSVNEFNVEWEASRLHSDDEDVDRKYDLLEKGAADVQHLHYQSVPHSGRLLDQWEKRHADAVPVSNQTEIEDAVAAGVRFHLIPEGLCKILRSIKTFFTPKRSNDPLEALKAFRTRYKNRFTDEMQADFAHIISLLEVKDAG